LDPKRILAAFGGVALGALQAGLAAARRGKAFHPHGEVYAARVTISAPIADRGLFGAPAEYAALVRFSRALGLPRPLPDLLGLSIRVFDVYGAGRHQDLLLVSSADWPIVHHLFLPAGDVQQRPYSSASTYRAGARRVLLGALAHPASPGGTGATELERARSAAATGRLRFRLAVAAPLGRMRPVGELHVGAPLPPAADALRFSPLNAGPGLEPVGVVNGMRRYAYPMSQWSWGRLRRGAQEAAERVSRDAAR